MGVYTITTKDEADDILGRAWGFPAIGPEDKRTVQQFNQDYLESLVQKSYNNQVSSEAVQATQLSITQADTNIIMGAS